MKKLLVITGLLIAITGYSQTKISELPEATSVSSSDLFVIVQSGSTKNMPGSVLLDAISDSADNVRDEFADYAPTAYSRVLYRDNTVSKNPNSSSWDTLMHYNTAIGTIGLSYGHHIAIQALVLPYVTGANTASARLTVKFDGSSIGTMTLSSLGEQDAAEFIFHIFFNDDDDAEVLEQGSIFYSESTAADIYKYYDLDQAADLSDADNEIDILVEGYAASNDEVGANLLNVELIVD